MPPNYLGCEALSALTGHDIKPVHEFCPIRSGKPEPDLLTHHEFIHHALFTSRHDDFGGSTKFFVGEPSTENASIRKELFVHDEEFFDPLYDYDFTDINDGAAQFKRGNELYKRPCGWNRIALKVLNKYNDGNGWLGTGPDAWPVSYHGTSIEGAKGIIQSHYKPGRGTRYGRGIYSVPEIDTAVFYSEIFTSKTTMKSYEVVLQNRINPDPEKRKIFKKADLITKCDYWLVPVPEGTSSDKEKEIVQGAIRAYGLLLKEL